MFVGELLIARMLKIYKFFFRKRFNLKNVNKKLQVIWQQRADLFPSLIFSMITHNPNLHPKGYVMYRGQREFINICHISSLN